MIKKNIYSVGAIDWDRKLFDELIYLPDGTSYNSYLIIGSKKTALIDTVDITKTEELLLNLERLNIKNIDYVISNHAEQDHSGSIPIILDKFPKAKLICNSLCKKILLDEMVIDEKRIQVIKDLDEISLGDKTLKFIYTPWVHWPETMSTFLKEDKILFSCDFFGAHLATSELFVKDTKEIELPAKRYYAEIMMPFRNYILKNLEKIKEYKPKIIAPSHGKIYKDVDWIINKYYQWSKEETKPEIIIAYTSMHGSTKKMVDYLTSKLINQGNKVKEYNLTTTEIGQLAIEMVDASTLIIASPTFLGGLHPIVSTTVSTLNKLKPKTKIIGFMGSKEWGGEAFKEFENITNNFESEIILGEISTGIPKKDNFKQLNEFSKIITEKTKALFKKEIKKKKEEEKELSIVLSGEAGQGLVSVQNVLLKILKEEGFYFSSNSEYMSRVRGGVNTISIRLTEKERRGNLKKIDLLLALDKNTIEHLKERIDENTIIIGNKEEVIKLGLKNKTIEVSFKEIAEKIGNKVFANTVATGTLLGILNINKNYFIKQLKESFSKKGKEIVLKNIKAAEKGILKGKEILKTIKNLPKIKRNKKIKQKNLFTGAQAIAYGAIAGGCDFISAYPMSPSTGVLQNLAKLRENFDIIVEQAEDEISAINMCLGASFAGAKPLTNTSGGGFALMCEGVSLAGMIETPLVIHIAQRPGPATGLPTRTAQEDLNLVMHAGHGEFARIIYAPKNLKSAVEITNKAFIDSHKYQIPVFILTDQYFMENLYPFEKIEIKENKEKYIVESKKEYQRYAFTENGISPRAIPGFGKGLVCVDSDEHDQTGHITENFSLRVKMVKKRLKRIEDITFESLKPTIIGEGKEIIIIGWGSTFETIKEAVEKIDDKRIKYLHYEQLYPIYPGTKELLKYAKKIIVIEGNATGQFAEIIKKETNKEIIKLLKYNGLQFFVEEIMQEIKERLD
jgi:2-oxoglutarate ferredoxin oxidoreductase subunit alpha